MNEYDRSRVTRLLSMVCELCPPYRYDRHQLADRYDVSYRTICRDLQELGKLALSFEARRDIVRLSPESLKRLETWMVGEGIDPLAACDDDDDRDDRQPADGAH